VSSPSTADRFKAFNEVYKRYFPKTPQPASSSACLSGPGPSTSRSIAWWSRRTDLGRQKLAGAERIGSESFTAPHTWASGLWRGPTSASGASSSSSQIRPSGHTSLGSTSQARPNTPLNGFSNGLLDQQSTIRTSDARLQRLQLRPRIRHARLEASVFGRPIRRGRSTMRFEAPSYQGLACESAAARPAAA
jgi:hypothetical protein